MDIITSPPYEKMQEMYRDNFSLFFLGNDISNKFALISLVCYITNKLKKKKPDITHWTVLYKINSTINKPVPEDWLKRLAVICSDFGYGCKEFPTFGLDDKQIPSKIKELIDEWLPF